MQRVVKQFESVPTAVRRVVSGLEECDPFQLGTLDHVDDPELTLPGSEGQTQAIDFQYCGYSVRVHRDRTIAIEP